MLCGYRVRRTENSRTQFLVDGNSRASAHEPVYITTCSLRITFIRRRCCRSADMHVHQRTRWHSGSTGWMAAAAAGGGGSVPTPPGEILRPPPAPLPRNLCCRAQTVLCVSPPDRAHSQHFSAAIRGVRLVVHLNLRHTYDNSRRAHFHCRATD